MGLRYFAFLVLLGLTLTTLTVDAKSLKAHKKSHKQNEEKIKDELTEEMEDDASGSAAASGSGEESGAPPTESETTEPAKPLPYKVIGPLGGHPHPGPPSAFNPCPQPRYCDPARCKDPIGCAPSCSETCCADILIPPPTPPVGSGGGPCPQTCAPNYLPDCCMGAAPPMGPVPPFPQPGPQSIYPPMGPQPGYSPPTGMIQPGYVPQAPPASCDQSCYATNCAPPCPAQCCRRKKSLIHRHRKTRSLTQGINMCH